MYNIKKLIETYDLLYYFNNHSTAPKVVEPSAQNILAKIFKVVFDYDGRNYVAVNYSLFDPLFLNEKYKRENEELVQWLHVVYEERGGYNGRNIEEVFLNELPLWERQYKEIIKG